MIRAGWDKMRFAQLTCAERCLWHMERGAFSRAEIENTAKNVCDWLRDDIGDAQEKAVYARYVTWAKIVIKDRRFVSALGGVVKYSEKRTQPVRLSRGVRTLVNDITYMNDQQSFTSVQADLVAITETRRNIHKASGNPLSIRMWLTNRFSEWKRLARWSGARLSDMDNVMFDEWLIDYVQGNLVDTYYPNPDSEADEDDDDDGELSIDDDGEWDDWSGYSRSQKGRR